MDVNAILKQAKRGASIGLLGLALTACGGDGGGAHPVNSAPTANAGNDQAVDEGSHVLLLGVGSDKESNALVFTWKQVAGPEVVLADPNMAAASFVAPEIEKKDGQADLVFKLTVSDGKLEASDEVSVAARHVNKSPSISVAGGGEFAEYSEIILDAGNSSDPDGESLAYRWEQVSGKEIALSGESSSRISFRAPKVDIQETFEFKVTADDGRATSAETVEVTVLENSYVAMLADLEGEAADMEIYLSSLAPDATPRRILADAVFDVAGINAAGELFAPSFDRRYLAFKADTVEDGVRVFSLYVHDVQTGVTKEVFDTAENFGATEGDDDGFGDGVIAIGSWSQRSPEFAFIAGANVGGSVGYNVYVYDAASNELRNVSGLAGINGMGDPSEYVTPDRVEWADDGEHIAFCVRFDDRALGVDFARLFVAPAAGDLAAWEVSDFESETEIANDQLYRNRRFGLNTDAGIVGVNDDSTVTGGSLLPDSDANLDGIADGSVLGTGWAWAPGGKSLYYIGDTGALGVMEMHVVDLDGANHHRLTHIGTDWDGTQIATDSDGDGLAEGGAVSAAWSPTGERIVVRASSVLDGTVPLLREWVMDASGDNPQEVVPDMADLTVKTDGTLAWSLSGRYLLVKRTEPSGFGFIHSLFYWDEVEKRTARFFAEDVEDFDSSFLRWLPEDKLMFFGRPGLVTQQIYFTAPGTSSREGLFESSLILPEWWTSSISPTGDAFTYSVRIDPDPASAERNLGITPLHAGGLIYPVASVEDLPINSTAWTPDGKHVVFMYQGTSGKSGLAAIKARVGEPHYLIADDPETLNGVLVFQPFGPPAR